MERNSKIPIMKTKNEINIELVVAKDFNTLLEENTRYVEYLANQFKQDIETTKDLESIGQMSLFTAMNKFDPTKSPVFIAFASRVILNDMKSYLIKHGNTIRIPLKYIQPIKNNEMTPISVVSINTPINDKNGILEDLISSETPINEDYHELYAHLSVLNTRQRDIISMRYGLKPYDEPYDFVQIAKKYKVSKQRIYQISAIALSKLQKYEKLREL